MEKLKDMTLDEIIGQLTKIRSMDDRVKDWKVRIGWTDGHKSCVGKILGVASGDEGTAYLFPVPEDIGNINALFDLMTSLSCDERTKHSCEECDRYLGCEKVGRIEENIRMMRHDTIDNLKEVKE